MSISREHRDAARRVYEQLNDSAMQRRLRAERAMSFAAVYWQPGDYDRDVLVRELKRMRELGFDTVRFHTAKPTETSPGEYDFTRTDDWLDAAADAGIGVCLHVVETMRRPSDALLAEAGMSLADYEAGELTDAKRALLERTIRPIIEHVREHPALRLLAAGGEPGVSQLGLEHDDDKAAFAHWLERKYGTVEALDAAWNLYPQRGRLIAPTFDEAWRVLEGFDVSPTITGVHRAKMNYGAGRDLLRFLTDKTLQRQAAKIEIIRSCDDRHPLLIGSHQLFANQPAMRWDIGAWARLADQHFCSLHPAWHFELVEGELDRMVYAQARMTRDYFKHGWTSCFETVGGPVQYSGGYGNAMSPGLMRRMTLAYLAAGNVNFSFWTWNARPGGWEAGEYGLTSLSGKLTPWAQTAGEVIRAAQAHRDELWEATDDPHVGLLESWEMDAIVNFEPERHEFKSAAATFARGTRLQAVRARVGAHRALQNHQLPYEVLTSDELLAGIACRYPVIYLPHGRAISDAVLDALTEFVQRGGRLVADVPLGFLDDCGKLRRPGPDSAQGKLFGAWFDNIHDARTQPRHVGDARVAHFFADVELCGASVVETFDDGSPAMTEHRLGKGTAVLVGFDPARECQRPGNAAMEAVIASVCGSGYERGWSSDAPMAFRRHCEAAHHYFLFNDTPQPLNATLEVHDATLDEMVDVLSGKTLSGDGRFDVPVDALSAVWLRGAAAGRTG